MYHFLANSTGSICKRGHYYGGSYSKLRTCLKLLCTFLHPNWVLLIFSSSEHRHLSTTWLMRINCTSVHQKIEMCLTDLFNRKYCSYTVFLPTSWLREISISADYLMNTVNPIMRTEEKSLKMEKVYLWVGKLFCDFEQRVYRDKFLPWKYVLGNSKELP